jgi:hypothetical protein
MKRVLILIAVCALALPLFASPASPMKAGKWEVTVQMDMPGMSMPPRTFTRCVTKEEAENAENAVPKSRRNEGNCKVTDVKVEKNTVTWKVTCDQGTGEGKMTYEGDTYTGELHMKMSDHEMTTKYSGKRLGDCDK